MESKVTIVKIVENEEIKFVITALNASDYEEQPVNDDNKISDVVVKQQLTDNETQEVSDTAVEQTHNQKMYGFSMVEHVCGKCDQIFTIIDNFKKHILMCKTTTSCFCCKEDKNIAHQGNFPCSKCDLKFHTKLGRQQHKFSLHAEDSEFKCKSCDVACPSQVILDMHMRTHLKQNAYSRDGRQEVASKFTFTDMSATKLGRTTEPSKNIGYSKKQIYQCSYCDKSYCDQHRLNYHVRSHTGEKPFRCDYCRTAFRSKGSLYKHRNHHFSVKPFKCTRCRLSFNSQSWLSRHFQTNHTGQRAFVCSICQKGFERQGYLLLHKNSVHYAEERWANQKSTSVVPKFKCNVCKNVFTTEDKLLSHICVRDEHRPYVCAMCNRTYIQFDFLVRHTHADHPEVEFEIEVEANRQQLKILKVSGIGVRKENIACITEPIIKEESEDEEIEIDYSYVDYDEEDDNVEVTEVKWFVNTDSD